MEMFLWSARFRDVLMSTERKKLLYNSGKTNAYMTILTDNEFCKVLTDLRERNLEDNGKGDALLRKDLAKFVSLYKDYGKDSVLLGALAYNCGSGVVNKSSILKKLKAGDRDIFKAYTSLCRYKGKWHKGIHSRRLTEFAALFVRWWYIANAACGGRNFERNKRCNFITRSHRFDYIWLLIYIRYISCGEEFVVSPIFNSAGNKSHFGKHYIL